MKRTRQHFEHSKRSLLQHSIIQWLTDGKSWAQAPQIVETHAALIFLVGDRAFKLKKAVNLGYLDFSTLESRRSTLERELRLNRRTAPDLYLRTLPITRTAEGKLALQGSGETVEWLLEMQRFPTDALLSQKAKLGQLNGALAERLAIHIAQFHDREPLISGYDWPKAVERIASENTADLRTQKHVFDTKLLEFVIAAREKMRRTCAAELQRQSGDVRHCHGDLHLGNVFLDGDQPTLFDCIEFDEFYASIPPLYDLAFLLMDLRARGLPQQANQTLSAWIINRDPTQWSQVLQSLNALPLYLILRAEIRAKTQARTPGGHQSALHYLEQATSYAQPFVPRLLAIGGFSGTGKSSLARSLAWQCGGPIGALHLSSDTIRKRMAGLPLTTHLPPDAYTREASKLVYANLFDLAGSALRAGQSVILDAVFADKSERAAAKHLAEQHNVTFSGLWLEAPGEVLESRINARRNDPSDADVTVLRKQSTYDLGTIDWQKLDVSGTPSHAAQQALSLLGMTSKL